jgi:hypothetical protein
MNENDKQSQYVYIQWYITKKKKKTSIYFSSENLVKNMIDM